MKTAPQTFLASIIFALVVLPACGEEDPQDTLIQTADPTGFDAGDDEDFVATAGDFACLQQAARVDRVHLWNPLGHLDEAIDVAEKGEGRYPVGTILQLVPQEAMVKRAPGYNPETLDWELFYLSVDGSGTTILERGGAEVHGAVGRCAECHSKPEPQHDFTCRDDRCDGDPEARPLFAWLVEHDPRCAAASATSDAPAAR